MKIYTIILIFIVPLVGCNDTNKTIAVQANNCFINRYPLDTNYFKIIKTSNNRDMLIILGPSGEKELSYIYDERGLRRIENYTNNKLTRNRFLLETDSLNGVTVIDSKSLSNTNLAYTTGYLIDKKSKIVNTLSSDYFIVLNKIDTIQQGSNYTLQIDTKNIKSKKGNVIEVRRVVSNLNENFAYTDESQIDIYDIYSDTIKYVLKSDRPGVNNARLVLYRVEKDEITLKRVNEITTFMFDYEYYVKPNKELGPYHGNFQQYLKLK